MWLYAIATLLGSLLLNVIATEVCNPKACARQQHSASFERPVCGSDGLTYPSRCIFEKARCHNNNVTLTKRGVCKIQRTCAEWEGFFAQNQQLNNSFVPNCRPDGSYDSTQCHPSAGYCWCVTPEGTPLPYTSQKRREGSGEGTDRPRCGRRKKSSARRRSPARKHHKTRLCRRTDKSILNNNLINSFHSEYIREMGRNDSDQSVITWKFRSLDGNRDGFLDKDEYRDLRKIVKKAAKPKRCARQFPRACDVDRDGTVGEREWEECLARDGMDVSLRVFLSLTADGRGGGEGGGGPSGAGGGGDQSTGGDTAEMEMDTNEDEYPEQLFRGHRAPPDGVLTEISQPGSQEDESSEIADDPTDCISDRKTALAEGYHQLYVPECTPDGRYQKIQCYKSAGYCWCVNEDTGRNIPGTSVKNGTPNCNQLKTSNKTMKGCPDDKKIIFLKELLHFLHSKMSEIVNSTSSFNNLPWIASKEEQAATWSFVVFDKNKNKMLERSEWKSFKEMVGTVKSLRKCGKKLPRYCDSNKDRQISMTEWLECLNVQQGVISVTSPPSSRAGKKNPLSILKDD